MPREYHKTCVAKCHNSYQDYRGGFSENLSITTAKNAKGSLPNDVGRSKTSLLFHVPFFGRR